MIVGGSVHYMQHTDLLTVVDCAVQEAHQAYGIAEVVRRLDMEVGSLVAEDNLHLVLDHLGTVSVPADLDLCFNSTHLGCNISVTGRLEVVVRHRSHMAADQVSRTVALTEPSMLLALLHSLVVL